MKREKLIKELEKLPEGVEVVILDWRKNIGDADEDGSSAGIYPEIEIELHHLEGDEAEYYKERHGKAFKPFASLQFANVDYNDDGSKID